MRVFVKNGGTSYVIPCKDPKASVAALKREALARCFAGKLRDEESRYKLVLVSNGAVLCEEDAIQDVLADGEFVSLRKLIDLLCPLAFTGLARLTGLPKRYLFMFSYMKL